MKINDFEKYNEKKQHGSREFPIQIYCVNKHHTNYIMPLHWHKELEMIKIITGKLELYINNVSYTLFPGDIAIINCKFLHRAMPHNCQYNCIVFDLNFMAKTNNIVFNEYIYPIISGNHTINCVYNNDNSKLYFTLNSIFQILKDQPPYYKLNTTSCLFAIFEQLYSCNCIHKSKNSKKQDNQSNIIAKLLEWIDSNYTNHFTLESLSKMVGLTPNYLCRIFKNYTGKTPFEYINYIRIQNICREMRLEKKTITEIAINNGYNDISYFCKVFKKHMGVSAKKYLESIQ